MIGVALNLLGLVKKHWKIFAVGGVLLGAFWGGWEVNGWRLESSYAEEMAERDRIAREAAQEAMDRMRAVYEERLGIANGLATSISAKIAEIRAENDALSARIEASSGLVKPSDVTCIDNTTGIAHEEQPNPFGDDFVRLWNDAGGVRDIETRRD